MASDPTLPGIQQAKAADRSVSLLPHGPPLFLGEAGQGPLDRCEEIGVKRDFERLYGAPSGENELPAAVALCLANGGAPALVLRVAGGQADRGTPRAPELADYRAAFDWLERNGPRFGLLVLPRGGAGTPEPTALYAAASELCRRRRAILLLEPPLAWSDLAAAIAGLPTLRAGVALENAALYLPRLLVRQGGALRAVGPAGAVAGAIVATDRQHGPWTASAGVQLQGLEGLVLKVNESGNNQLSALGVNVIRQLPQGVLLWGARTLAGADARASEWKYLPVRRLALAIEDSLEQGLRWTAFEPNGEPLWAQVREASGVLLHELFRAGAFAGGNEREAWFLRCDSSTMTAADIAAGRLNVVVGFAPVRPAEFVVLRLGLWTRADDD